MAISALHTDTLATLWNFAFQARHMLTLFPSGWNDHVWLPVVAVEKGSCPSAQKYRLFGANQCFNLLFVRYKLTACRIVLPVGREATSLSFASYRRSEAPLWYATLTRMANRTLHSLNRLTLRAFCTQVGHGTTLVG